MKRTEDEFRALMDEVEVIVEKEKRLFRNIKDSFRFKSVVETLEPRRRAFDHALQTCLDKNGIRPGNLRSLLDQEWHKIEVSGEPSKSRRVISILAVGLPPQWAYKAYGAQAKFVEVLNAKWNSYLDSTIVLVRRLWNETTKD